MFNNAIIALVSIILFSTVSWGIVYNEYDQVQTVIVHTPEEELFFGVLHPDAALFASAFSLQGAKNEHKNYIKQLKASGANVYNVRDVLIQGTLDTKGNVIHTKELNDLRQLASQRLKFDISRATKTFAKTNKITEAEAKITLTSEIPNASDCSSQISKFSEQYKRLCVINKLHPKELVKIILQKPTVYLDISEHNTDAIAQYVFDQPEMNLYFVRDPMITTAKGIILGKMSSVQRAGEPEIIRFVLQKLNRSIIYEIQDPGKLEGGDFLPANNTAFIASGLRTNYEGIKQLMRNDLLGYDRVVVVKDQLLSQDQMHLDTFFNIIGPNLALLAESRMAVNGVFTNPAMQLKVDVWERSPQSSSRVLNRSGNYELKSVDLDFQNYLEKTLSYKIISVSDADQLGNGTNSLTVKSNTLLTVNGLSPLYFEKLMQQGVVSQVIDFTNLAGGWGATHCTTQVIDRK